MAKPTPSVIPMSATESPTARLDANVAGLLAYLLEHLWGPEGAVQATLFAGFGAQTHLVAQVGRRPDRLARHDHLPLYQRTVPVGCLCLITDQLVLVEMQVLRRIDDLRRRAGLGPSDAGASAPDGAHGVPRRRLGAGRVMRILGDVAALADYMHTTHPVPPAAAPRSCLDLALTRGK